MSTVTLTRDLMHPQDKVWRAITTGALLAEWLLPNDFQPVVGHRFTLQNPPMPDWDGVIQAQVREVTPPERLVFSWVALGVVTEVTLSLTSLPKGTRLTVEQSGFTQDQARNLNGARHGWGLFLDRLSNLMEIP